MKRVGILTFQRADNHGALLQCYALYKYLKLKGTAVEVVDYRNKNIEKRYTIFPELRWNLLLYAKNFFKAIYKYKILKLRKNNFERLRDMVLFSESLSETDLKAGKKQYDILISGSDQLWNKNITSGFDDIYFLDFSGGTTKATYAVSVGDENLSEENKSMFREKISDINYISLRESSAVSYFSEISDKNIVQCVDPTLLLDKQEWHGLAAMAECELPQEYIFLYFVQYNEDLVKAAELLSKDLGIPVICLDDDLKSSIETESIAMGYAGPIEFLKIIENARAVVTSSFHASVFSSLFQKDVYIFRTLKSASRTKDLTALFGIENQVYLSFDDFKEKYKKSNIEYNTELLEKQKQISMDYLEKIIQEK